MGEKERKRGKRKAPTNRTCIRVGDEDDGEKRHPIEGVKWDFTFGTLSETLYWGTLLRLLQTAQKCSIWCHECNPFRQFRMRCKIFVYNTLVMRFRYTGRTSNCCTYNIISGRATSSTIHWMRLWHKSAQNGFCYVQWFELPGDYLTVSTENVIHLTLALKLTFVFGSNKTISSLYTRWLLLRCK